MLEVDVGILLYERSHGHGVVLRGDIALLCAGHLALCKLGLNSHCIVGETLSRRIIIADKFGDGGEICAVGSTDFLGIFGLVSVIVTVAEAKSTLLEIHGVLVRIGEVGLHTCAEEHAYAGHCSHEVYDFLAGSRGNHLKVGGERSCTFLIEAHAVHTHAVEIGYLLCVCTGLILNSGKTFNEAANLLAVVLAELIECTETGILGFERIGFHPAAACIVVKVSLGRHCSVEIGGVDTLGSGCLGSARSTGYCQCRQSKNHICFFHCVINMLIYYI